MTEISEDSRKRWYDLGLKYLNLGMIESEIKLDVVESVVKCFERAGYTRDVILTSVKNIKDKLTEAGLKPENQQIPRAIAVLETLQKVLEEN